MEEKKSKKRRVTKTRIDPASPIIQIEIEFDYHT